MKGKQQEVEPHRMRGKAQNVVAVVGVGNSRKGGGEKKSDPKKEPNIT